MATVLNDQQVKINDTVITKQTLTRYVYPVEFVSVDGDIMMRSNDPYGTWPIELIAETQSQNNNL